MLHIYYGMGKGKTSTLNGSLVRARGAGLRVGYFKFLKGEESSEDMLLNEIATDFQRYHYGKKFVFFMDAEEKQKTREAIKEGMKYIIRHKDDFDVIILDELLDVMDESVGFFTEKNIMGFLNALKDLEVLVSGHAKYEQILQQADLVTHYEPEKHYYNNGVEARKGIEF